MKVMISAFVAALVIAFADQHVLDQFWWSSAAQTSSENVRLD